jgi:toxin ParE1/3/4
MRVTVLPEAEAEALEARNWYEERRAGLGQLFVDAVEEAIASACESPEMFPVVDAENRRVLLHRFPYAVFYRVYETELVVLSVFHCRREPGAWAR